MLSHHLEISMSGYSHRHSILQSVCIGLINALLGCIRPNICQKPNSLHCQDSQWFNSICLCQCVGPLDWPLTYCGQHGIQHGQFDLIGLRRTIPEGLPHPSLMIIFVCDFFLSLPMHHCSSIAIQFYCAAIDQDHKPLSQGIKVVLPCTRRIEFGVSDPDAAGFSEKGYNDCNACTQE